MITNDVQVQYVTKEDAELVLIRKSNGSYLVRKINEVTGTNNFFMLSVVCQNEVHHYQICKNVESNLYYIEPKNAYETISKVCEAYQNDKGGLICELGHEVVYLNEEKDLKVDQISNEFDIADYSQLENFDWFHGYINDNVAYERLNRNFKKNRQDGVFLVRSKSENLFVLSVIYNNKECKYRVIRDQESNLFNLEITEESKFDSLEKLITFLQDNDKCITGLECNLTMACSNTPSTLASSIQNTFRKFLPLERRKSEIEICRNTSITNKDLQVGKLYRNETSTKPKSSTISNPETISQSSISHNIPTFSSYKIKKTT